MTTRHEQLRRYFEQAIELPTAARDAFLDSKCGGDMALKQRLQAMLAAAERPSSPPPAGDTTAGGITAPVHEGPGTRIGSYKLLQLIGEGGFGAVFLAEQEEPVVRKVALKIIKLGMDTRRVVARFEQERQALALMDHPNIARVLDAGSTQTGRPYFVMDLVRGEPIVDYCDQNKLTVDERLELFAQVCQAVQHAHGKGIIHRDLKPSNVLVAMQDGKPLAKVIDFGIAKATTQKLTDKTLVTEQQQVIGTLEYMSPEQAAGSLDIDTRADVYSLGVLLYELLTGTTPFDKKTVQKSMYSELHRMIREVEPDRPSTRLSESHETLGDIAAHRRTEPGRLTSMLRGELDWIVMKAIDKDRARRYETANGLAMDIRRYLAGEPVVAAPPGAAYRLRKLVLRHRGAVAAAAAVAVALLLGLIAFAWQADVARGQRDVAQAAQQAEATQRREAETQRQLAERNQAKADAINKFLLDMLGSADVRELGREVKVAQVLDHAAADVDHAFADRTDVGAAVRQILGRTYLSLGLPDRAAPQLEAALLHSREQGTATAEYGRSLRDLAALKQLRGDHEAAAADFAEAAAVLAAALGPEHRDTLAAQVDHGNALVDVGRRAEAEPILRAALETRTRVHGRDDSAGQVALNSLAVLLHYLDRLDEAEPLYREAAASGERIFGPDHPETITAQMNLASFLRSRRKLDEAEPMMARAYAAHQRVFGESHPKTAVAARVLGSLYADLGRFKDALPLYETSLAIRREVEGDRSEAVAETRNDLAQVLNRMGNPDRAVTVQGEAIETLVQLHGADSGPVLAARLAQANMMPEARRAEAAAIFEQLLEACPRVLGEDHRTTFIVYNSYGVHLLNQERFADAEPFIRKALAIGDRVEGENGRDSVITSHNLAVVLRETGRLEEAEAVARDTVARFTRVFGARHANVATAKSGLAQTLVKLGRVEEAQQELVDAIAVTKGALGETNPAFVRDAVLLGRLLVDQEHAAEAEPLLRDAAAVNASARGAAHRTANAQLELGRCLQGTGRFAEAEPLLTLGHQQLVAVRPAGHADIARAERYLAAFYAAWNAAEPDAARAAKAAEWQARVEGRR